MLYDEKQDYESIVLNVVTANVSRIIDRKFANIEVQTGGYLPTVANHMVLHLTAHIAQQELKTIKIPTDWWQHFKLRWFPKRLLGKYPVRYDIYDFKALYPLLALPEEKSQITVYRREGL